MTASRRALPHFLIVGAQKSGTSSLYSYLCQHPSIHSATVKQVHYFDFHFAEGNNWYRTHFPMRSKMAAGVTGEATPNYLVHPWAAKRCRETLPEARLIFVLRNPIERAYSHFHHCVRHGLEDAGTFEQALDRESDRLAGEVDKMLADETYRSDALQHYSYMLRGEYMNDIERWLALFPREQMLFLSTEELLAEGQDEYNKITDFLGLQAYADVNWRKENVGTYADMPSDTRQRLADHFRPHNEKLFQFLGRRLPWKD